MESNNARRYRRDRAGRAVDCPGGNRERSRRRTLARDVDTDARKRREGAPQQRTDGTAAGAATAAEGGVSA